MINADQIPFLNFTLFLTFGTIGAAVGIYFIRLNQERYRSDQEIKEREYNRQRQKDDFEKKMKERELEIQREIQSRQFDIQEKQSDQQEATANSGYVFFEIEEEYKPMFHDAIVGFKEYAKLKGYSVSLAIDTSPPGKVGIKIIID